jgi:hypothetical protein
MTPTYRILALMTLMVLPALAGCQSRSPVLATDRSFVFCEGLDDPQALAEVQAIVVPPAGWTPDPLKQSSRHTHQVWISPSGNTAYGVIRMRLPLPVGPDLVLWGFMNEMKRSEGEGRLLAKEDDDTLPGLRFIAEGGRYRVRTNLITSGRTAWAIYAGTLRGKPTDQAELHLAERARESTSPGLPQWTAAQ